jgi:hypothetical protein
MAEQHPDCDCGPKNGQEPESQPRERRWQALFPLREEKPGDQDLNYDCDGRNNQIIDKKHLVRLYR